MKNIAICTLLFVATINFCAAQQAFYDVTAANGNGIRFWGGNDGFKISMGYSSEYQYGPVSGFSIRTTMDAISGRGWTWGHASSSTNVAAIDIAGNFQIAGMARIQNNNEIEFGLGLTKTGHAGKIAYQQFSTGLDITGAGTSVGGRKITFWNEGGAEFKGNVGIGTSAPQSTLHLSGTAIVEQFIETTDNGWAMLRFRSNGKAWQWSKRPSSEGDAFRLTYHDGTAWQSPLMCFLPSGNVGIGTTAPNQKLTVNGTIYGKEVKVDLSVPGPDYVFEKSYSLPTLDQVKSYIDQNKHLPDVPSAAEMEKNGINLSEMNMLLLKKVEELTLYVIELKKELDEVKSDRGISKH